MPEETKFTDIAPLDYYYKHGYKLMNPFCRILSENPQYRFILEWRNIEHVGEKNSRQVLADSITIKTLMGLRSLDSKSWDLLGLDESQTNTIITGDASAEHESFVRTYEGMGVTTGLPSKSEMLAGTRKTARDKLGSLWRLLVDTKIALANASPPTCSWLIRGDTEGMVSYLATQGAVFPVAVAHHAFKLGVTWRTNQFFSTSVGDVLASLAGKALVWLIRINPGTTQGRSGGIYTSEAEVLFPYDVTLTLVGGIAVSSVEEIKSLNLQAFVHVVGLREKLLQVYQANGKAWPNGLARFVIAVE